MFIYSLMKRVRYTGSYEAKKNSACHKRADLRVITVILSMLFLDVLRRDLPPTGRKHVRFIVASGTAADCTQAKDLIKDTGAKYLLAARSYYTNAIIETAHGAGMEVIIPPKKTGKVLREKDID